ncbi:hypothetical protein LLEC1_01073 [Akanthomyces lecanii]|uniref:Uncharacterized protein n=1 Tax=Cordyceps confragosa TaxID=2714763 RepID=A0A179IC90_CORDF|nr:hypothetical protein LLEC1_01073 [Akanthomyces lecanii]
MCIAILSTAHPEYSLIILDNRDEYILRRTSRPHWWTHPTSGAQILSSRDLQRAEQGTWMAVNKAGDFAILTNYQEIVDESAAISTTRSRGGMPSLWVGEHANESPKDRVHHLVKDGGVKGVGGFSMICGRLRKKTENISIISNRADHVDDVPVVNGERGRTWALSNTTHTNPEKWPKVSDGEELLRRAIQDAVSKKQTEAEFIESLFTVLNHDTLPPAEDEEGTVQDSMKRFRHSVFLPPVGTAEQKAEFAKSAAKGRVGWEDAAQASNGAAGNANAPANPVGGYSTGLYGTQRQTVILVNVKGTVTYIERALFDPNGNAIERGAADVTIKFTHLHWPAALYFWTTPAWALMQSHLEANEPALLFTMGKGKMGISELFSTHKNDLHNGRIKQPLVISSPVGPVKNSRGPDFTRSDGLIIVDAINDCGPPRSNDEIESPATTLSEKRMAISVFARKTLLKTQSLASLSSPSRGVKATSARTPRSRFDDDGLSSSVFKLKSASGSTTMVLTDNEDHEYIHTTKPPKHVSPQKSMLKFATKLPKSKTMNVLQDIKNSVPRRTNFPTTIPRPHIKKSDTSLTQSEMSANPSNHDIQTLSYSERRRRCLSGLDSASSSNHSFTTNITTPDSCSGLFDLLEPRTHPGQVLHGQSSSYWSGRFTTIRDRLAGEHMAHVLSQTTDTLQMGALQQSERSDRTEDAELCGNPPYPLQDEDDLCRQIFGILDSQCITRAAKDSLQHWQAMYARSRRRPSLLPRRNRFFGESQISRRFASHIRHQDVQNLAFLEDAYYSNASNAFGMTNPHSLEGRYLNFR